jgi:hypothetical protein
MNHLMSLFFARMENIALVSFGLTSGKSLVRSSTIFVRSLPPPLFLVEEGARGWCENAPDIILWF